MSYTKRQFVTSAFEEAGLAEYVFDLQAEDLDGALRRLDAMMAEWNGSGIRLGYPLPSNPDDSDLDDVSYVPDWASRAVYLNLAVSLCAGYGKIPAPSLLVSAKNALTAVQSRSMSIPELQMPVGVPAGAGMKSWRWGNPFLTPPTEQKIPRPEDSIEFK